MPLYNLFVSVAAWFRRHLYAAIGVALLLSVADIGTDRLIGGRAAEVAGRFQFIVLVAYILLALLYFMFRPYQRSFGTFLRSVPMQYFTVLLATVLLAFGVFMIGLTIHSIARDDI